MCNNYYKVNMKNQMQQAGPAGAIYGLGFVGAVIYFIGHAATFWLGVLGFLKAIVWPVFVVYHLLQFLNLQ
jgi:hypothetical protein